jgi:thiosulfate/3-mercaptopyruvate sulfurtransferase
MKLKKRDAIAALVIVVAVVALFFIFESQPNAKSIRVLDGSESMLVPLSEAKDYNVILDISPAATTYIEGAININYEEFFDQDKRLKPADQLSRILGNAGISRDDSVLIYGKCQPCGGGPSAATYAFWVLKYLGQNRLGLLDGEIEDWAAAGLPTSPTPAVRPKASYVPKLNAGIMATYDQVNGSNIQIVDARTPQEHARAAIPGSVNIPYDAVLENGKLKNRTALTGLFVELDRNRTVAVYTATGVKASMEYFALELIGHNALLYTWNDWMVHNRSQGFHANQSLSRPQNTLK